MKEWSHYYHLRVWTFIIKDMDDDTEVSELMSVHNPVAVYGRINSPRNVMMAVQSYVDNLRTCRRMYDPTYYDSPRINIANLHWHDYGETGPGIYMAQAEVPEFGKFIAIIGSDDFWWLREGP